MISIEKALEFEKKFRKGEFPHQRYGQAFCNYFNLTCSELFYEENYKTAKLKIWLNFVIFPENYLKEE